MPVCRPHKRGDAVACVGPTGAQGSQANGMGQGWSPLPKWPSTEGGAVLSSTCWPGGYAWVLPGLSRGACSHVGADTAVSPEARGGEFELGIYLYLTR